MKEVVIMGTETAGEVLLKTPLYDTHVTYKARSYLLQGIFCRYSTKQALSRNTWQCVPNAVFFDVSHMGGSDLQRTGRPLRI